MRRTREEEAEKIVGGGGGGEQMSALGMPRVLRDVRWVGEDEEMKTMMAG